jgi:hypothetical protein
MAAFFPVDLVAGNHGVQEIKNNISEKVAFL